MKRDKWFIDEVVEATEDETRDMVKEAAKAVEADAKNICPKKSGAAAASIKAYQSKYDDQSWIVSGGGEDAYYFTFIELGSKNHVPKAPLRRSLGKNRNKIKDIFGVK